MISNHQPLHNEGDDEGYRVLTPEEVATIEARRRAAIQRAQGKPGTSTTRMRLSIDFSVTIAGTPPDDDGLNEPDSESHARQARLLEAVKSNPVVLRQWMVDLVVSQMIQKGWSYWYGLTGGEASVQELLAPVLAGLSEDDKAYFAEAEEYLEDAVDLFASSFSISEDPPVVREVEGKEEVDVFVNVHDSNGQSQQR